MRIRVLHMIDHLGYGGAPFVVKNIVERMPADRVESIVCALRPNLRPLPIDATVITLTSGKYSLNALRSIVRICEERRVDIVHAHLQKAILIGLLMRRRLAGSLALHEHGPIFRGGTGCVYRWFLRRFGSRADAILANSQAAAIAVKSAMANPDAPVSVVPNFIDIERFDPDRYERNAAREALGLADGQFAVGFVGRLDRAKGADLLVEAAAILRQADDACRFFIVGDGPERQSLEARVRRLGLEGMVTVAGLHENTASVMRGFDVAVVPSRREAFGIAALELMRMKVPVIVSPVGGLPELVQPGRTGIVLAQLTPAEIARAIRTLKADAALRDTLARNAFEHASTFDGREPVKQILDVYTKLCRERSAGASTAGGKR